MTLKYVSFSLIIILSSQQLGRYFHQSCTIFPGGSEVKASASNVGDLGSIPGWGDPLEKDGMATHSSTLAWKTLWMEKPGGLQSMESQRVEHG